jgi:alkylation response protein AidB-like acyl-CoA dehydrogenase
MTIHFMLHGRPHVSQALNWYKTNLRELRFVLFEQLGFEDVLGKPPYDAWTRAEAEMVLTEIDRFAREVIGPLNGVGDKVGCRLENGKVFTPPGFKEAWKKLYDAGWKSLSVSVDHGGQGAPSTLHALVEEFLAGANTAFSMYPGLTFGAAEVIAHFGTDAQKATFLDPMFGGKWGGTMCLTEPHAGSDVGAAITTARELGDGTYAIQGTKIFISAGDHDLAENVIHLVLARIEGAPAGTKGLSLFIVPKLRPDGSSNDVKVQAIEHKMGINGSATCVLGFGEEGGCVGELVGGTPHAGMMQMFRMMNGARIAVAIQGLALGSTAYLNALEYAKERKQGSHITRFKDPTAPKVAIVEHPDVRRMLLDMKSRVEGIRALIFKLTVHQDKLALSAGRPDAETQYHKSQIDLLVPIVKSYASDQGFRICETAIQVYGGAGFLKDHPVEQYARDAKIFSIYEGTNHIQAMDLVGRKLPQNGGGDFRAFLGDVGKFVAANAGHPVLGADVKKLGAAAETLGQTAMQFMGWMAAGKMPLLPLAANRFLEMMAEVAVCWMLLDGARIAEEKLPALAADHPDRAFYTGKREAALYFARNVLPGVAMKAQVLASEDTSAVDIPLDAF